MPNVIRLGDPTSHGGKVTATAASHVTVDGIAVATVGDPCSCPIKGHAGCVVAQGDSSHTIDGAAVAYDGHKTSCGATLQSSITTFSSG